MGSGGALARQLLQKKNPPGENERASPTFASLVDNMVVRPLVIESLELRMPSDNKLELHGKLSSDSAREQVAQHFRELHLRLARSKGAA